MCILKQNNYKNSFYMLLSAAYIWTFKYSPTSLVQRIRISPMISPHELICCLPSRGVTYCLLKNDTSNHSLDIWPIFEWLEIQLLRIIFIIQNNFGHSDF